MAFVRVRFRQIMNLSVSDQDGACNPVAGDISHQAFQRAIEIGAIRTRIALQDAHFQGWVRFQFSIQRGESR